MTKEDKTKETETKEKEWPWYCWLIVTIMIIVAGLLIFGGTCGCAKVNVAETTPEPFLVQPTYDFNVVEPEVKVWPDYIEIKAEVKNVFGTDYNVNYRYFKETKESGVEAVLSLDPIGATEKLPSKIYINKFGKIEKVSIWGVGEYECSYNYEEMSGSLCKHAGLMYFQICEVQMRTSDKGMTCKEMVDEISLKEPAEWL